MASSYSQVITSNLKTFSMKKNSVAVEKYFLFIQNIFSSQLKNTHTHTKIHCIFRTLCMRIFIFAPSALMGQ